MEAAWSEVHARPQCEADSQSDNLLCVPRGSGSMRKRIQKKTAGSYSELMLALLDTKRPTSGDVDEDKVSDDIQKLYNATKSDDPAEAQREFTKILSSRSWTHIRAIRDKFGGNNNSLDLIGVIEKVYEDDSDTACPPRAIVEFSSQPYEFWAERLMKSLRSDLADADNEGIDLKWLQRLIISRAEVDLKSVIK